MRPGDGSVQLRARMEGQEVCHLIFCIRDLPVIAMILGVCIGREQKWVSHLAMRTEFLTIVRNIWHLARYDNVAVQSLCATDKMIFAVVFFQWRLLSDWTMTKL